MKSLSNLVLFNEKFLDSNFKAFYIPSAKYKVEQSHDLRNERLKNPHQSHDAIQRWFVLF